MKKTSLLLVLGLALVLASAAAPKANAGVVVGIGVGAPVYPVRAYGYFGPSYVGRSYVGPGYVARPYCARPYFGAGPYVDFVPAPVYSRVYVAPGPVYYSHSYPRRYVARRDFYRYGWLHDLEGRAV